MRGRVTIDGIPLRGTEPRGFRDELFLAGDVRVTDVMDVRVSAGLVIDGIYPAGHASTHVGPLLGIAAAVRL